MSSGAFPIPVYGPSLAEITLRRMSGKITRIGRKQPVKHYIRELMALESPTLTQKRLAERMGCEPGTVSKLLNDGMKINLGWLANFAAALNKSVPELFIDPRAPTRDELLAAGTPEELRQAIAVVKMAKAGTRS